MGSVVQNSGWLGRSNLVGSIYPSDFNDVAAVLADNTLTYSGAANLTVVAGDIVRTREEGFSYEVAASGASDHHATTAGGVKLYALQGDDGNFNLRQFGALMDGATDARAAWVLADTAAQAAGNGAGILVPPGTSVVATNLTVTSPVVFAAGGRVKPSSGATLTLSAPYAAGDYQRVFDISASGTIAHASSQSGYVTPAHWGAVLSSSDNYDRLLACFNSVKPDWSSVIGVADNQFIDGSIKSTVVIPMGEWKIGTGNLPVWSHMHLRGQGARASIIQLQSGSASESVLEFRGSTQQEHLGFRQNVENLTIGSLTRTAWGIRQSDQLTASGYCVSWIIQNVTILCAYGLHLNRVYNQQFLIRDVYMQGGVHQCMRIAGNRGRIENFDNEGGLNVGDTAGDGTADPYFLIGTEDDSADAGNIVFNNILTEGLSYTGKHAFRVSYAQQIKFQHIHMEQNVFDKVFSFSNAQNCSLRHMNLVTTSEGIIEVTNSSDLTIFDEGLSERGLDWTTYYTCDSTSNVRIEQINLAGNSSVFRIGDRGVMPPAVIRRTGQARTQERHRYLERTTIAPPINLCVDPYLQRPTESLGGQTAFGTAGGIIGTTTNKLLPGANALRLTTAADRTGPAVLYQQITIGAEFTGKPFSAGVVCEITPDSGAGDTFANTSDTYALAYIGGAGVPFATVNRGQMSGLLCACDVVYPDSTGTLRIDFGVNNLKAGWTYDFHMIWLTPSQELVAPASAVFGELLIPVMTAAGTISGYRKILSGNGTPEAVITGNIGDIFMRADGGAGTSMYVKESGTGNTGWVAK